jgi:WD40 repeat protein
VSAPDGTAGAAASSVDRVVRDPRISESSGLAVSGRNPSWLLTHNDSGGAAQVFAVDAQGRTAAVYRFAGVTARDWEGMARIGEGADSTLYLGDIGDNRNSWRNVAVYIAPEPAGTGRLTATATRYRLTFPDGPRDAEALMVSPRTGRVYVVTKRLTGAAIYLAPSDLRPTGFNRLEKWRDAPAFVTDGAFSPDGSRYALRGYTQAFVYDAASGALLENVDLPAQPQGESLTWSTDGRSLLVGSEGQRQEIWQVPLGDSARVPAGRNGL